MIQWLVSSFISQRNCENLEKLQQQQQLEEGQPPCPLGDSGL